MRRSRWWKLKSCNYVFLWGPRSDKPVFINAELQQVRWPHARAEPNLFGTSLLVSCILSLVPFDFFFCLIYGSWCSVMPRAGPASAQRSVRRGWAQGRVALSRGADWQLKSNPAFLASMENSLVLAPVSLPLWNHWWGKADSRRPQPEAANAAGSSPCPTLQSHWMHRMHHPLMKGHWSHMKKNRRPLYRKLSRPTRFPGIYSEILFGAVTKVKCIHV